MFIRTGNINSFPVFYFGDNSEFRIPGKYYLDIKKNGVGIWSIKTKLFIPYTEIESVEVAYNIKDKSMSAGGAIIGGAIAGTTGSVIGASMGGRKIESILVIKTKNSQASFDSNLAESLLKKINKRLNKFTQ